jgi:hypothetical protein
MISSNNAMCVRLDERHIHRFNHRRLSYKTISFQESQRK